MGETFYYESGNYIADLNDLRLNDQLCDVTIKVNKTQIRAHKLILTLRLKYFKSLFLSKDYVNEIVVTLENINERNLEKFISFAYTGSILITESNVLSLLEDAHQLKESGIKKACVKFLENNLSPQDAVQALQVAECINCFELKIIARKKVPMSFEDLSRSTEYMSLNYESLQSFLSARKMMQTGESEKMVFEAILKWIMHDIQNRKIHLADLLSFVDMNQLTVQYLWTYLRDNVANKGNEGIVTDIMSIHSIKSKENEGMKAKPFDNEENTNENVQEENAKQQQVGNINSIDDDKIVLRQKLRDEQEIHKKLMITNMCDNTAIQVYYFSGARWYDSYVIHATDNSMSKSGAILNDKLYYVQSTRVSQNIIKEQLRIIDYTGELTTLELGESNLSGGAVCACDQYLYICGGVTEMNQVTHRVQRFNPLTKDVIVLAPLITERCGATSIIYQGCLHVLGGRNRLQIINSVEKFNPNTMMWMSFPSMCEPRKQCAAAILNGKLYACGGFQSKTVEFYDPEVKRWQSVADMNIPRYGFLVIAHDGKLIAFGGDRVGTVEIYDPSKDQWTMDEKLSNSLQQRNPIGGLIYLK